MITDPELVQPLSARVEQAILGGARLVQYRNKSAACENRAQEAAALTTICRDYHIPLIVNDDVTLADRVGADGVHLGRKDSSLAEARRRLGREALIGVSCYNNLAHAERAARQSADYVAFGSFYPSTAKPEAAHASIELLRRARAHLTIPICAIGGITAANATPLIEAGADLLAVINGVFGYPDSRRAARRFTRLFPPNGNW